MKNKIIMLFVDGVGIGEDNPEKNPFFKYNFKFITNNFNRVPSLNDPIVKSERGYIFPVDAVMGIDGLPQSGTGQVSIFCGINAQKKIEMHFGPFPYSTLIDDVKNKNIFKELLDKGKKVCFANAYPKIFFDYIDSGKRRLSVTSLSCLLTGVNLLKYNELKKGKALAADINNYRWVNQLNYNLPVIKCSTAANRLIKLSNENDFVLYEYFATDYLGHGRNKDLFEYTIKTFDDFINELMKRLPENTSLFICSDHGNFEDLSSKTHTKNPAFAMAFGKNAEVFYKKIKSLKDIKKVILELLT